MQPDQLPRAWCLGPGDRVGAELVDDVGRAEALGDVTTAVVHLQEEPPAPAGFPACQQSETNSATSPAAPVSSTGGRPS